MPHRTAADIMARSVVTLSPGMDIYGAMQLLLKKKISGAPVVDPEGRLVGVLSEKDCLKVLAGGALDGLPEGKVSDYMTRSVESITPTTSIYDIVHGFLQAHFRRLPVVDQTGRVVGQISRRDVLVAIESIRDNSYLYGTEDKSPPKEGMGVDSAMRRARGR